MALVTYIGIKAPVRSAEHVDFIIRALRPDAIFMSIGEDIHDALLYDKAVKLSIASIRMLRLMNNSRAFDTMGAVMNEDVFTALHSYRFTNSELFCTGMSLDAYLKGIWCGLEPMEKKAVKSHFDRMSKMCRDDLFDEIGEMCLHGDRYVQNMSIDMPNYSSYVYERFPDWLSERISESLGRFDNAVVMADDACLDRISKRIGGESLKIRSIDFLDDDRRKDMMADVTAMSRMVRPQGNAIFEMDSVSDYVWDNQTDYFEG